MGCSNDEGLFIGPFLVALNFRLLSRSVKRKRLTKRKLYRTEIVYAKSELRLLDLTNRAHKT